MITNKHINYRKSAANKLDCSLGNMMFKIAGPIGVATMNGYAYGFSEWVNQEYFKNPLPRFEGELKVRQIKTDFFNTDFGFKGFDYPDNMDLRGEFGSWKYFEHCKDLIKFYFELIPQCEPFNDCILMHYRHYGIPGWCKLTGYYKKALKKLPKKRVVVVTDNIDEAYKAIGLDCDYTSNTPIVDFYLLCNTEYLVMANSTFSWWGAYLSGAVTVAPSRWYDGVLKNAPTKDLYLPGWTII